MSQGSRRRRALAFTLVGAGAAAVVAGAGYAAKRVLVDRVRGEADPHEAYDATFPSDTRHHRIPTDDGGELHVVERTPTGDRGAPARTLVLLHGIGLEAGIWHYQFRDLADGFRVIAIDTRGHGGSTPGTDGYGLGPAARDLAMVLDRLAVRDAIVVGHSMGGIVLMRFAADHRDVLDERVAGLVFLATVPHFGVPAGLAVRVAGVADRVWRWSDRRGVRVPLNRLAEGDLGFAVVRLAFGENPSPTHIDLTRRMISAVPVEAYVPSGARLLEHDARVALAATATPSIVVVGTLDRITPSHFAEELAALLPDAQLVVLPGCGHQVMLERRAELADLLRTFDAELRAGRVERVEAGPC
ncbi:MAG: alpha/beta fold hydrolase [Acidimicrobiales bacterium]